jgi:hypothetical protein
LSRSGRLPATIEVSHLPVHALADGGWLQEGGWRFTGGDASAFLHAFGQDGQLDLQTGKGVEVGAWTLKGTAQVREAMRKVCNL